VRGYLPGARATVNLCYGAYMFVEVRYRGLRLAEKARFHEVPGGGFVELEGPMPVGTPLLVGFLDGEKSARVTAVVEQEASAKSPPGMKVAWDAVPAPIDATGDGDGGDDAANGDGPEATQDSAQDPTQAGKKRRGKKKTPLGRP
jgi:hypothetical protein